MVVDFPAPFGPRNPVTVPGWTVNVRSDDGGGGSVAFGQCVNLDHVHHTAGRGASRNWGAQPVLTGENPTRSAGSAP